MEMHTVRGIPCELRVGLTGRAEILQNIQVILASFNGDVVLDRRFAWRADVIDAPENKVQYSLSRIVAAIRKYEPRVSVHRIRLEKQDPSVTMDGTLVPVVELEILDEGEYEHV